jgi:hypothetical protein
MPVSQNTHSASRANTQLSVSPSMSSSTPSKWSQMQSSTSPRRCRLRAHHREQQQEHQFFFSSCSRHSRKKKKTNAIYSSCSTARAIQRQKRAWPHKPNKMTGCQKKRCIFLLEGRPATQTTDFCFRRPKCERFARRINSSVFVTAYSSEAVVRNVGANSAVSAHCRPVRLTPSRTHSALLFTTLAACLPVLPVCGSRTSPCGWPGFDRDEAAGCLQKFANQTTECM